VTTEARPQTAPADAGAIRESPLLKRRFTRPDVDPYDELQWELRTAVIAGPDGQPVFEQKDVEFPASWSQNATNVVVTDVVATTLSNVTPQDGGVFNAATRTITWTAPASGCPSSSTRYSSTGMRSA